MGRVILVAALAWAIYMATLAWWRPSEDDDDDWDPASVLTAEQSQSITVGSFEPYLLRNSLGTAFPQVLRAGDIELSGERETLVAVSDDEGGDDGRWIAFALAGGALVLIAAGLAAMRLRRAGS